MSALHHYNYEEVRSKGLEPLDNELVYSKLIEIEPSIIDALNKNVVCIYDILSDEVSLQLVKVPRVHDREIWFITEDSYTDNLDNETFTFFKYCLLN